MSDISVLELLEQSILDVETGERLFDDARPDLYVSDVRGVIAEIRRLTVPVEGMETTAKERAGWKAMLDNGRWIACTKSLHLLLRDFNRLLAARNEQDVLGERVAAEGRQAQGAYELTLAERNWWKDRAEKAEAALVAAERRALERAAKVADDFRDVMLNTDLQTEPLLWLDGAEHAAHDVAAAIRALAGEKGT